MTNFANNNNIIPFPKGKMNEPPQSMEEIKEKIGKVREQYVLFREQYIKDVLHFAWPRVVDMLSDFGIDMASEDNMPLFAMYIEMTKALISKSVGIPHSFDDLAHKYFTVDDDGFHFNYTYNFDDEEEED